ncbi:MAG TPA: TM0106 family RecB-like putative nuclease [Vicinamibacterales bacterium]|nr:TM0106 family RecB-like putative nuclease [Vicinamibacterales bacterium]
MQRVDGHLFFSPSDLNHFVECEHLTTLDMLAVDGHGIAKEKDPQAEIIRQKGFEHEQNWLEHLRHEGRHIVEIAAGGDVDWEGDAARTEQAMRDGAEVIYQAVFREGCWRGVADFLMRVDRPSQLGAWSYEAADAKLARHPKPYFILQLCWYTEQLERLQGVLPDQMHVVLGSREILKYRPHDFLAYYRAVRTRFDRAIAAAAATYPLPVGHCHVCGYASHCDAQREDDDHLSLVAGMRRDQVERLNLAGVTTVEELAVVDPAPTGLVSRTFERLQRQARLQVEARTATHRYELLAPEPKRGFGLLPALSDGDVFFDIEGYPYYSPEGGLEYLWGIVYQDAGAWTFRSFECVDRAGEKRAFEAFIDFLQQRLGAYPGLHVYHYAPYETTAVTRLMAAYATREAEVDDLLRRGVFVDLYQVVRQSMQISYDSYSLKRVRKFFMRGAGQGTVTEGGESILEFQRFLETGDASVLDAIRDYNEEDCHSTRLLRDWLLERKVEAEQQFACEIPWYVKAAGAEKAPEERDVTRELRERLLAMTDPAPLLGHLLDYHRREAKPGWWAFFARLKKSLDELRDDTEAIAFLEPAGDPVIDRKSLVHPLTFPDQEFKLRSGSQVCDPVEGKKCGDIVSLDSRGRLDLKRGPSFAGVPLPQAVIADGPVPDRAQRESLARIADALLAGNDDNRVARDLLSRVPPRFIDRPAARPIQTMDLHQQQALATALDDSCLFIQGPPGSGKTYTGARLITSLVKQGKRVAVTATSHKAIHNLLDEVIAAGRERGVPITGLKKGSDDDSAYDGDGFENTTENTVCAASDAPIVAGTAWLFSREEMTGLFDYLFIDEAGQVSLADAVAMSPCARNLVLLGDPQQLPHVTQSDHPGGAGVSVLEHLLDGDVTVAPDRGIFLEQTWRMHPGVCGFISTLAYEGRLRSDARCATQRIDSAGLSGTGLRYLAVAHAGNAQQSQEEVDVIAAEVRRLLDTGRFTDCHGATRRLTPADILVVAPYNMQVRCLLEALPDGVEAGTVDKFQGREAPVVFFSMATSSGEDIPRGLDFLFSRNRLNVAISRAKALAVLVCSPRLLETRCRTVEQMRLVNGLCAFAEQVDQESSYRPR